MERYGLREQLPETVHVTTHCRLAYLERVNPMEPYPAAAVRDLWNRSERSSEHKGAKRADGLYLVYDIRRQKVVILTVYPVDRRGSE